MRRLSTNWFRILFVIMQKTVFRKTFSIKVSFIIIAFNIIAVSINFRIRARSGTMSWLIPSYIFFICLPILNSKSSQSICNVEDSSNFLPSSHQQTWKNSVWFCLLVVCLWTLSPGSQRAAFRRWSDTTLQRGSTSSDSVLKDNLSPWLIKETRIWILSLIFPPCQGLT